VGRTVLFASDISHRQSSPYLFSKIGRGRESIFIPLPVALSMSSFVPAFAPVLVHRAHEPLIRVAELSHCDLARNFSDGL